ncbi:hypothetical protein TELCIR_09308 [Teladorsagia circumcincta]|uniref:Arrestin C-terminal-like domain-containing protein n=1 Tax=Teladorsagia circumcincta TaxID=45464 RepID=A0A2G9UF75_TELCI|nr:hypothetical protein TELCIR_09308 [Teladorsagia circumcincta]
MVVGHRVQTDTASGGTKAREKKYNVKKLHGDETMPIAFDPPFVEFGDRITEVVSSGGNVHVEMAYDIDGKVAAEPLQYWDIRPFQTKTICRAVVVGHTLENTTVFLRFTGLLLDDEGNDGMQHSIVLPIPIEVNRRRGVFTTKDMLDFGKPSDLVKVFFDASRISFESQLPSARTFHGRIIALSRGGNYNVTIPFRVTVYQGDIVSVGNDLALQEDIKAPHKRSVRLRNALPFPVAIWNISISPDASQYFTVELFSVDQESFDFGLLERNDTRTIRFVMRNKNPAIMTVRGLSVPRPSIHRLYLVSILGKNTMGTWVPSDSREEWPQGGDLEIPPHSAAFFDFELRLPLDEPFHPSQMIIATEFESKVFPVKYEIVNLTLANPTSVPIAVQVIPLVIYPDADAVVEFFREHLITPLTSEVEMNETLMFSLRDTELFTLKPDSPVPRLREELEAAIPQTVPRFTLSLLLKPHMKVRLRLGFLPSDYTLRSSLLLIRNNLTVIEPVVVYGRGARIGMRVENMEARSKQPLLFEIRHDHLSDCNNPKRDVEDADEKRFAEYLNITYDEIKWIGRGLCKAESQGSPASLKKKKAQVSIIHSKVKEMKDKDKDATKAKHATQQQQQQASTGVKKVQPVAPMHKLSAKLSMSPKAPTNQRKKSGGFTEADRRLARAQQLMDADLERHTVMTSETTPPMSMSDSSSTNVQPSVRSVTKREEKRRESGERNEHAHHLPQPVPVAPVQQIRSTSPSGMADSSAATLPPSPSTPTTATSVFTASYNPSTSSTMATSMPMTRPSVIPVSAVHPTVYPTAIAGTEPIPIPVMLPVIPTLIPGLTLPIGGMDMTNVSLGALAEYYGQISAYDDSNMPATPTPSLASSVGTDRTGGLREMNTPEFARSRRHSESEQSVASELSAAPDWLDEVVGPDDVDDDFSAMAAASEFLMSASGEDAGSSRAQTPQPLVRSANTQHQQKRRTRRDKRRRRGRSSGNEGASSSDKSHRNAIGAERVPKKTLAAELNEERRRREDEYLRSNNAGGLGDWPMPDLHLGSLIESDERTSASSRLWPPTPIGSRSSLAGQWNDPSNAMSSSAATPDMSYDPMSLGLSLGPTVAPVDANAPFNIFAGADFSLWSNAGFDDTHHSWSNNGDKSNAN